MAQEYPNGGRDRQTPDEPSEHIDAYRVAGFEDTVMFTGSKSPESWIQTTETVELEDMR